MGIEIAVSLSQGVTARMFDTNFTRLDWVIVVVYLVGTGCLGIYVNRHVHNASDYLVGGRGSGTALSIASFIGTGLGLVTLMYAAMDGFTHGFSFLFIPVLGMIVPMVLGATGFVIRRLRQMRLTTIPEYYQRRFNRRVRVTAGIICALAGILNMGLFPKMGATFITFVTGMGSVGEDADVTVNVITTLLILLALAYTVVGGMVAVIVTDYIQFVVLSLGLGLGLWMCFINPVLGWDNMVHTFAAAQGEAAFNPVHPQSYGWIFVIWMMVEIFTAAMCWAPEATRALTTRDERTTKWTFFFGSPGFFARMAIPALWGIAAFCFMQNHGQLSEYFSPQALQQHGGRAAEAMPLLMGNLLPTGLLGLLVAGLMAALMSTHDSYFLAWASVISQDIVAPLKGSDRLSDRQSILYTRVSVVVIAVFLLTWGIWYELPESVWTYMAVTGTIYLSGSSVALIGGMYWRRASSTGALWCMLGGLLAISGLFVKPIQSLLAGILEEEIADIARWFNEPICGLGVYAVCLCLFVTGSLLYPDKSETSPGAEKSHES